MNEFKDRLRSLRKRKKFTQKQLAEMLFTAKDNKPMNESIVRKWESGKNYPSYKVLMQLIDLFQTDANFLMGISESPPAEISSIPIDILLSEMKRRCI